MDASMEDLTRQVMTVTTAEQYVNIAQQKDESPIKEDLPGGGSVGWFGATSAQRVLAYIPGGGLVAYAGPQQIGLAYDMYKAASAKDGDVAVAILSYETCLSAPYPAQLSQTVAFVNHLLKGRDAENIELFGDSAGGMLIIGLLLHIAHPHPKVPRFSIPPGHTLGRILLISPLGPVVSSTVATSKNTGRDQLTVEILTSLWNMIEANHDPDVELINPWLTPSYIMYEDWYTGWPVGPITVLIGGSEILEEELVRISKVIKMKHRSLVDVHVDENATHCAFVKEGMMGIEPSKYTLDIIDWARS